MEHRTRFLSVIIGSTLLIALDQTSKYIVHQGGGFYICNPHVAFGIPVPAPLFWIFWIAILSGVVIGLGRARKEANGLGFWGLLLVLAGALANIVDRLALGCVVDFVDFKTCLPVGMVWPLFNLADVFIVLGALLWLARFRKM